MGEIALTILNGSTAYSPATLEGIKLERERKGTPSKLTFKVLHDPKLKFEEGNAVLLTEDGNGIFYGFVFSKKQSADGKISVTAYDQLRYLKNKETYVYTNKRADQIVQMIANDFNLNTGSLANTGYIIPQRAEDNQTLFDIIGNALDITMTMTKEMFVLYDDYGKLTLKNIADMKTNLLICDDTAEDYDYESSIDKETYNVVKLYYEDSESKKRQIFQVQDSVNINKWGKLQYSESIQDPTTGASKAESLLSLYDRKTRTFTVKNALGRSDIRGGSMVFVKLELNDFSLSNYMIVDKVTHNFDNGKHTMDLTLLGSWGDEVHASTVGLTASPSSGGSSSKSSKTKHEVYFAAGLGYTITPQGSVYVSDGGNASAVVVALDGYILDDYNISRYDTGKGGGHTLRTKANYSVTGRKSLTINVGGVDSYVMVNVNAKRHSTPSVKNIAETE